MAGDPHRQAAEMRLGFRVCQGSDRQVELPPERFGVSVSGFGLLPRGEIFREDARPPVNPAFPRATEQIALDLAERGLKASVVRLPRSVHELGERHGFIPMLTARPGGNVARSDDDVRDRLRRAALALFLERGYERTTAAEIAARGGVTERTFFRHFADKREVLFDSEATLRALLTQGIADAPSGLSPVDTLFSAAKSVQPVLEENRPYAVPRHELISSTPALQERELAKTAALADALAGALTDRGVPDLQATLAARIGMAAFVQAVVPWLKDPQPGLGERLDRAFGALKELLSETKA